MRPEFFQQIFEKKKQMLNFSALQFFGVSMRPEFFRQIFEKKNMLNFMKIRPVGPQLFHALGQTDGETDKTKL